MDTHVNEFYTSGRGRKARFTDVIPLHDQSEVTWGKAKELAPALPRGWFELVQLPTTDRLEFTQEFWLAKLPFHPHLAESIGKFFSSLDEIGVFITQDKMGAEYEPVMVFSIAGNGGYFSASPPATYEECMILQSQFPEWIFPDDYLAFLQMYNGLHKSTDMTGIIHAEQVKPTYDNLQAIIKRQDPLKTRKGKIVDARTLIPFYESFGMPIFQCFWSEWHHELGMGNVYYSVDEKIISDTEKGEHGADNLAFPTFAEWLMFYLEPVTSL